VTEPQLADFNKGAELARGLLNLMAKAGINVTPQGVKHDPATWPILTLITFLAGFGISWDSTQKKWVKAAYKPDPDGDYMELKSD